MATSNEEYRDAVLRHQIGVRRYSAGLTLRIAQLLELADRDLVEQLRTRLARFEGKQIDFTGERWAALLADIRTARSATMAEYRTMTKGELSDLSKLEAAREVELLVSAIPIQVDFASVALDQLRAIATSKPFHGRLLGDWYKTLETQDQTRLTQALQIGMTNGEPIDDIVRRIVGTRANKYSDGILSITRRDAQTIVRTAVNHVSNTAREYVWDANQDIITARIWHATLDGRTSAVCRARDGCAAPVGDNDLPAGMVALSPPNAKPPAHMNCRSIMVAYIDGVGLVGKRPTVSDTRTPDNRETDFRAQARSEGRPIQEVRADWAAKNIGRVPAATTYQEFLSRQSAAFQNDVLGQTKGALFRRGDLTVQEFVDRRGNELTLSQLAATKPQAFIKAGLDPASF